MAQNDALLKHIARGETVRNLPQQPQQQQQQQQQQQGERADFAGQVRPRKDSDDAVTVCRVVRIGAPFPTTENEVTAVAMRTRARADGVAGRMDLHDRRASASRPPRSRASTRRRTRPGTRRGGTPRQR